MNQEKVQIREQMPLAFPLIIGTHLCSDPVILVEIN